MKTQELEMTPIATQKVQLVKGEFTPSEASDIVINLIREKINFHKLQRLQLWEGDHNCKTDQIDTRIDELNQEKETMLKFINSHRNLGVTLKINGIIELEVAE
ncbi:hypothetical protein ACIGCP_09220 [Cellulophaga baltica]|uniref:hypothetical protein n=1 Tax=Cellulophaga baltica TaxID=76594 RepID=UPI0037C811EA